MFIVLGITVKTGFLQNFLQYLHTNRQTWKGICDISAGISDIFFMIF
jgi:hypothetical protein